MGNFYGNVLAQKKGQKAKRPDFQTLVITEPFLYCAPEELNKVQLTMKLGKENAKMTCCLDYFLDE
jgi:hypothetical protein